MKLLVRVLVLHEIFLRRLLLRRAYLRPRASRDQDKNDHDEFHDCVSPAATDEIPCSMTEIKLGLRRSDWKVKILLVRAAKGSLRIEKLGAPGGI